jgi:phospholipase C
MQFLAVGHHVKKNYISHVQTEHASLIKFIEWNWIGGTQGQLGQRDMTANNLGDIFDNSLNIPI